MKVIAPDEISAWLGGSILASLSSFQTSTIERSAGSPDNPVYDEIGPRIVSAFDFQDWNTEFNSFIEN